MASEEQTTLILIKPDAIQRGLCGELIRRFETKGLRLVGMKLMKVPEDLAKRHYAEHEGKPFFNDLLGFIRSAPVMALAVRGPQAVMVCRNIIGATDGTQAAPGTIRGDFGLSKQLNLVHGSDSPESAQRELELWFSGNELHEYNRDIDRWITG